MDTVIWMVFIALAIYIVHISFTYFYNKYKFVENIVFDDDSYLDSCDDAYYYNMGDDIYRELLLKSRDNNRPVCYSKDDINEYSNIFFNFRNKTDQNSHLNDPVDNINCYTLSNKSLINGTKISDLYDQMTLDNNYPH